MASRPEKKAKTESNPYMSSSSSSSLEQKVDSLYPFDNKCWWSDFEIKTKTKSLYINKYQLGLESPVFNAIFEDKECSEIKMDYCAVDVHKWLLSFHAHVGIMCKLPIANLGTYIMICHKYEMTTLESIALKAIPKADPLSNIDVIEFASKTTGIFDSVMETIESWLSTKNIPFSLLANVSPQFLYECLSKIHKEWKNNSIKIYNCAAKHLDRCYSNYREDFYHDLSFLSRQESRFK